LSRIHIILFTALLLAGISCQTADPRSPEADARDVVRLHQTLIVGTQPASGDTAPETRIALRMLAEEKRLDLERLGHVEDRRLVAAAIESATAGVDEDLLAFQDLLAELASQPPVPAPDGQASIEQLWTRAQAVNRDLNGETGDSGGLPTRGEPTRSRWRRYLDRLKRTLRPSRLPELPPAAIERGPHPAETFGETLGPLEFVLTFDDGPHPKYTREVLAALQKADARAMFFVVGDRFAARGADAKPSLGPNAALLRAITQAGHVVGNHTLSHALLTKVPAEKRADELETNFALIDQATSGRCMLFRPPYGARPSELLDGLAARGRKSIMWSIDSLDWSDPLASSIASRVMSEARMRRHGIILMHDIHRQSAEALPAILSGLQDMGAKFRVLP
jgi:peptidoglycan/xylan/chitin deacetylase (PgdA/CDA1 family)